MKYIGNKTRLLDFIYSSMLNYGVHFNGVFFDVFGGTGSVGKFFKEKGFSIISNDIMTYSYIIQYVKVKMNYMPSFNKISKNGISEVLNFLNGLTPIKGYCYNNYAPGGAFHRQYFSDKNASKIDAIRDKIESWKFANLISTDEYYVLLSSLIDASDFVANISGTYGAYLKIWRSMALKPLNLIVPEITDNKKENLIYQCDANSLVKKVDCDVLYVDPPYNSRQYAPNFHVLESLAVWDKQTLTGFTGQRDYREKKSDYCSKTLALKAFSDLIFSAKTKYILVSYNNEGIIHRSEMLKILNSKGKVTEYTTGYRRFRTESDNEHRQYKQCDDKVVEHLYIVSV